MVVNDVFAQLPGSWTQTRSITPGGTYHGTALFTRIHDNTLQYREEGALTTDQGHTGEVFRSYLFKRIGDRIEVLFDEAEPRLFHELSIDHQGRAEADHKCGDDFYKSVYQFMSRDEFKITHTVTGPRKNYVMETKYVRN